MIYRIDVSEDIRKTRTKVLTHSFCSKIEVKTIIDITCLI